jgi:tetratricopeptide (TPR) repeat protein
MGRAQLVLLVVTAVVCGSKSEKKPAGSRTSGVPFDAAAIADAAAPTASTVKLTAAQRSEYRKVLRRGRKLAAELSFEKANVEFRRALSIKPGDPRASSELGWTLLQMGKLDASIAASRASVAAASDARIKAASLYNLGRALEKKGDKSAAVDAYRESFDRRPNKTVLARLVALGAAEPGDVIAPRPVRGPFASVAAYCKQQTSRRGGECGTAKVSPFERTRFLVICGADPRGRVSCTPTIELDYETDGDNQKRMAWSVTETLAPSSIALRKKSGVLPKQLEAMLGTHQLLFR